MTALRDIVVVLDGSASSEARLATSIALAQQHQACLTGLSAFELLLPARPVVQPRSYEAVDTSPDASLLNLGAMRPLHYPETDTQIAERVEQIEAAFRERLKLSGLQGDWRIVSGKVSEAIVHQARHADLTILGQVDPTHPPTRAGRQLVEDVLLTSGRPTLIIPYVGPPATFGTKILVAWNDSREAARAINDAIPLLAKAASVTVLAVRPVRQEPTVEEASLADLVHHLACHGINAVAAQTTAAEISVPDALLSYASDISADLLVAGGYGHSRLRCRHRWKTDPSRRLKTDPLV